MVVILLTDIKEVFSGREVVKHHSSPHFVEKLLLEVLRLVEKLLKGLGFFWKHVVLSLFKVVSHFVHFLNHSWVFHLPLLVVLFLEKTILFCIDDLLSSQILLLGAQNK